MIVPFECQSCGKAVQGKRDPHVNRAVCPECGAQTPVPLGVVPGVILGNSYRVDELIGESSGGDLYRGYHVAMQRQVMIKTLPPNLVADEEQFGRFTRGAKLTASLRHANILGALDAGEDCGVHYLVTEYKAGVHLGNYLEQHGGKLAEKDALRLLIPIAEGLKYAWDKEKILHRNIKPENILVTGEQSAALMDLGIAKSLGPDAVDLTGADYTVGTPGYMSPEQITGEDDIDFAADLYSLGIVLYRAVVGEIPFEDRNPIALMEMQLNGTPVPACERNPEVSRKCSALIDKMLAKERDKRHASWQKLIDEMRAVASGKAGRGNKAGVAKKAEAAKRAARAGRLARERGNRAPGATAAGPASKSNLLLYSLCAVIPVVLVPLLITATLKAKEKTGPQASSPPAVTQQGPAAVAQPKVATNADIDALRERVSAKLLADGPVAAVAMFTKEITTPEFAGVTAQLQAFLVELGSTLKKDDLILASLMAQIGKGTKIRLVQEEEELELRIKSVQEGLVKADRLIRAEDGQPRGTLGMTFRIADLHAREVVKRLQSSGNPRANLLCGLVALEAGSKDAATTFFQRDGGELAKLLLAKIKQ